MIYRRFFNFPTYRIKSPWEELSRMRHQLDQMFDDTPQQRVSAGVFPLTNLTEDKDNYYVRAELPVSRVMSLTFRLPAATLLFPVKEKSLRKKEAPGITEGNAKLAHFPG